MLRDGAADARTLCVHPKSVAHLIYGLSLTCYRNALPRVFSFNLYVSFHIRNVVYDLYPAVHSVDLIVLDMLTLFELSKGCWQVNANIQKLLM